MFARFSIWCFILGERGSPLRKHYINCSFSVNSNRKRTKKNAVQEGLRFPLENHPATPEFKRNHPPNERDHKQILISSLGLVNCNVSNKITPHFLSGFIPPQLLDTEEGVQRGNHILKWFPFCGILLLSFLLLLTEKIVGVKVYLQIKPIFSRGQRPL